MFAEFVVTYLPIAIAAVVLVPPLVVLIAMFVDSLRTKRWPSPPQPAYKPSTLVARRAAHRHTARRAESPVTSGGMGLRHGMAARRDHD